ncbi:hypothetical protein TRSC58_05440 [Trypanosoma rangeli SC58]|uniref:DPH-type MB domain-containing protein n=1 Tax=Trypanosoma rangeli SC58 TaxID=429131 RepID=A0A061IUR6_TRYRA|nr:hypothetical protein TRSC58_05440 [Trypanosoma rangeli SC58]
MGTWAPLVPLFFFFFFTLSFAAVLCALAGGRVAFTRGRGALGMMDAFHYEEVALSEVHLEGEMLRYPCPCGDLFELSLEDFAAGADVAQCPTCSLTLRIICTEAERRAFMSQHGTGGGQLRPVLA